jgi:hypothetical protein
MYLALIEFNSSLPFPSCFPPSHTPELARPFALIPAYPIHGLLRPCSQAKIAATIIQAIAIDMIHLHAFWRFHDDVVHPPITRIGFAAQDSVPIGHSALVESPSEKRQLRVIANVYRGVADYVSVVDWDYAILL